MALDATHEIQREQCKLQRVSVPTGYSALAAYLEIGADDPVGC
jgi:hypothetical protein